MDDFSAPYLQQSIPAPGVLVAHLHFFRKACHEIACWFETPSDRQELFKDEWC